MVKINSVFHFDGVGVEGRPRDGHDFHCPLILDFQKKEDGFKIVLVVFIKLHEFFEKLSL
jgi:hypothetical protein